MQHLVGRELPATSLVVAIDCGKVRNRAMLASGERGVIGEPVSLSTLREGVDELERLIANVGAAGPPLIAVEATGALHRAWARELERRFPGSLRLFAPSETQAARSGLGSRRFKTDDRDCAGLISLARQGLGRRPDDESVEALLAAVRHRRALIAMRKVLQQRLHDQLNALCPGLSAPTGHGRALKLEDPSGQAVLACAVDFAGRAPSARSLISRAPGRLTRRNAAFWAERWRSCLAPPPDAELRAGRLGWDLARWRALQRDVALTEEQVGALLCETPGQVLTTLPGVGVVRAAAFAAHSLPIERFATAEHLYSATGLAPAAYESATLRKRGRHQRVAMLREALAGDPETARISVGGEREASLVAREPCSPQWILIRTRRKALDTGPRWPIATITVLLGSALLLGRTEALAANLVRGKDIVLGSATADVVAADFNRDRDKDLATLGDRRLTLFKGRGEATFNRAGHFGIGRNPEEGVVADLDRDGKKDLVVPHFRGRNISVLLGRGDGTFKRRVNYRTGEWPSYVAAGRLNHDRYPDLAVTNLEDNDVSVYLGRGDGTLRRKRDYAAGYQPRSVAIADLNGDRRRDLVVAEYAKLSIRKGRGDGTFKRRRVIPMELALSDVVVGKFDRGGVVDLAVSNPAYVDSQGVHVFLGKGNATFRRSRQYVFDSGTTNIATTDMTGNGRSDLIVETEGYPLGLEGPERGWLYVLRGHSDGIFKRVVAQKLDGQGGRFAIGDFNGDRNRDIAAITYTSSPKIEILLNK